MLNIVHNINPPPINITKKPATSLAEFNGTLSIRNDKPMSIYANPKPIITKIFLSILS